MEARIIGPEAELGDVRDGLKFFDGKVTLSREWSDLPMLTKEEVAKLKGNQYVEIKGKAKTEEETDAENNEAEEKRLIKARLAELGEATPGNPSLDTLKSKLEAAEKKAAKQAEQAEADAANAED